MLYTTWAEIEQGTISQFINTISKRVNSIKKNCVNHDD